MIWLTLYMIQIINYGSFADSFHFFRRIKRIVYHKLYLFYHIKQKQSIVMSKTHYILPINNKQD